MKLFIRLFFHFLPLVGLFNTTRIKAQCDPIVISNVTEGCAPLEVVFNILHINVGTGVWSVGSMTANGLGAMFKFTHPGYYIITVTTTVNGPGGPCIGTGSIAINVVTGPAYGCTNTVAGFKDEDFYSQISIFPNPVHEVINISINDEFKPQIKSYCITNSLGQKIREENFYVPWLFISAGDLPPGIYQLQLISSLGGVTKKFVKL